MSRGKTIRRVQRRADTKGTKINAAEVSRVACLVLDEVLAEMDKIELQPTGGAFKTYQECWYDIHEFISRARRKHGSKRRGK